MKNRWTGFRICSCQLRLKQNTSRRVQDMMVRGRERVKEVAFVTPLSHLSSLLIMSNHSYNVYSLVV